MSPADSRPAMSRNAAPHPSEHCLLLTLGLFAVALVLLIHALHHSDVCVGVGRRVLNDLCTYFLPSISMKTGAFVSGRERKNRPCLKVSSFLRVRRRFVILCFFCCPHLFHKGRRAPPGHDRVSEIV